MVNKTPLVSVVLAVFNGEKYLAEAIESILSQNYDDYEFIIVDDGSTDSSPDIISRYQSCKIVALREDNKGLAPALNYGIACSKGKYIARMDADDVSLPDRLSRQIAFMEENEECSVLGTNAHVIDKDGKYLFTSSVPVEVSDIEKVLSNQSPFYHSSVIFRKDCFISSGRYYEEIKHHFEDFILWNKMKEYGMLRNLREPLIKYRIVPTALTNRDSRSASIMISLAKKILSGKSLSDVDFELLNKITKKKKPKRLYVDYYLNLGCIYLYRRKNRSEALRHFLHSMYANPINIKALFFIVLSLLPISILNKWMDYRGILKEEKYTISERII